MVSHQEQRKRSHHPPALAASTNASSAQVPTSHLITRLSGIPTPVRADSRDVISAGTSLFKGRRDCYRTSQPVVARVLLFGLLLSPEGRQSAVLQGGGHHHRECPWKPACTAVLSAASLRAATVCGGLSNVFACVRTRSGTWKCCSKRAGFWAACWVQGCTVPSPLQLHVLFEVQYMCNWTFLQCIAKRHACTHAND